MEKTTSIKNLASRVTRHPLLRDISFETILDYTIDFIQIVGCPKLFDEKTAMLFVKNHRALLPCDFISMIQVRTAEEIDRGAAKYKLHAAYRYSTDSFHMSEHKPGIGRGGTDLTYKIQGSVIFTSTKDIKIEIAYHAIATDNEGYPLLPDNPVFLRALESYIKKQWFTIQFDLGKLQPVILNQALQDYAFYVGQCQNDMIMPSIDEMESITNAWTTLIMRTNEHKSGFLNNGVKEYLTIQP